MKKYIADRKGQGNRVILLWPNINGRFMRAGRHGEAVRHRRHGTAFVRGANPPMRAPPEAFRTAARTPSPLGPERPPKLLEGFGAPMPQMLEELPSVLVCP